MYNNPLGPASAAAGLGAGAVGAWSVGWIWLFIGLAVFTLIGALFALLRVLPAGLTERPRKSFVKVFNLGKPLAPPRIRP